MISNYRLKKLFFMHWICFGKQTLNTRNPHLIIDVWCMFYYIMYCYCWINLLNLESYWNKSNRIAVQWRPYDRGRHIYFVVIVAADTTPNFGATAIRTSISKIILQELMLCFLSITRAYVADLTTCQSVRLSVGRACLSDNSSSIWPRIFIFAQNVYLGTLHNPIENGVILDINWQMFANLSFSAR